jgi:hypothetical protein
MNEDMNQNIYASDPLEAALIKRSGDQLKDVKAFLQLLLKQE